MTRSPEELQAEIDELRLRLDEAEETLRAIGSGEVDAFVVSGPDGEQQVFTLKGAEQPYRVLVETMSEGAATLTADGTILYCNSRLAAMLQVPLERLVGSQLGSYVAPDDLPLFFTLLNKCTEKLVKNDMTMFTETGSAVPVFFSCCSYDLSGNSGISVVVTDLTQQKHYEKIAASEAALRTSEERLALATSATQIGMFDLNIAQGTVLWTQTHEAIFGYVPATTTTTTSTTAEHDQRRWTDRVHPEDLPLVEAESLRCMQERKPLEVQYRIIWPDGSLHWVETKGVYQYDSGGKSSRMIGVVRDITEHKLIELALIESEYFFKESQRAASIGSYKTDFITGKWESSEVLDTTFGIDSEYIRSIQGWLDLVHPDDRDMMAQYLREEVIAKRNHFSKEYRIIRKNDGETRWVHGLGEVRFDDNGSPLALTGTIQDITERIQAEEALAEAHRQIQSIVDNAPAIVYAFDLEKRFVLANAAIAKLYNTTPAQMIGKRRHDFMPQTDADWHEANDLKVIEAGKALEFEEQSELPDCTLTWLTTKFPLRDAVGKIYAVGGISTDITERKKTDEALRQSEALYKGIGESIDYGVWVCASDGRNTYASESFLKMVGITQEQCSNFGWGNVLHPDDADRTIAAWQECVCTGKNWDIEHRFRGVDGRWHHVLARGVPVKNEQGEVTCWAGINLDIDRLRQAEENLRDSEESLRLVLQASSMGSFEVDLQTGEGRWNDVEYELLGLKPGDVPAGPEMFFQYVHTDDVDFLKADWEDALQTGEFDTEFRIVRADDQECWLAGKGRFTYDGDGRASRFLGVNYDITKRKQAETFRSMGQDLLLVLSEDINLKEATKKVIDIIKSVTGADAVGIRLQDEDDFPYFYQEGFPEDFLLKENSLVARTRDGGICRDECGDICLECTCGLVVTGTTDPSSPLFTKGGSSWTNDSFPFLHVPVDDDIRTNPRNECIHQGFASIALIPIRAKGRVVGVLQLNCRKKGCFTLEGIEALEKIAENIGESILRKQAEEALRESENRFRLLAETMLQGVVHQNANGEIISMNPAAELILGKSREDFIGNSSVSVEHDTIRENGEIYPGLEHPTMVALRTGQPVRSVVMGVYNPKLDEYRWIGIDAVPVFRPGEDRPSEVYSVFGDITERKNAEKTLQESEQRIQQALHVSRSFTFEWLPVTDQIMRSESCSAILKLTGDEAVNDMGEHFFLCVHPEDRASFGQILRALTPTNKSYLTEYRYVSKDDTEITLEETGQAYFDAAGKIKRLVGVTTDITLRKQAEKALQRAHEDLEQRVAERTKELAVTINRLQREILERESAEMKLREETAERLQATEALREKERMLIQQSRQAAMGEMIGNIAHQWRQPLNTLGLFTQRIGFFYGSDKFDKEFLDTSLAKSMEIIQYMSRTIDDFRNFFSSDRENSEFMVGEAVSKALSLVEASFKEQHISVERIVLRDLIIYGQPNEFAQVLLNILINAKDVIIERNVKSPRITICIGSENGKSVVTITDNAGGIPVNIIDKIFDPYFTTKGPQQGTGVGLFMSKAIIEKNLGGKLSVRNTDEGAEFRIEV